MANIPVIFLAFANDKVDNARYLRNLPIEHNGIRDALFKAQQAGLCEIVERANATIDSILDVFQNKSYKDRIAIFHYGGHADGYQLMLEQLDGSHSVAHGEGLVSFFSKQKGLKLVFFNGCSTQQQALELIKSGVPSVIGTSNSINDDVATNLSVRFYKSIANGTGLEKAWLEAIDQLKIIHGTGNMRALFRFKKKEEEEKVPDQFPWNMYFKEGSEIVKEWNLPEAVDNPLFGLPEIPKTYNLPENPYLFLRRYERPQAEIFFGRSYNIRDLYKRIDDRNSAPLILLYGQSGVGKSSLLDAGLLPRLEESHLIKYIRRNRDKGLLGTLLALLTAVDMSKKDDIIEENIQKQESEKKEIEQIDTQIAQFSELATKQSDLEIKGHLQEVITKLLQKKDNLLNTAKIEVQEVKIENTDHVVYEFETGLVKKLWHKIEKKFGKPMIIILDQVEETFVQKNDDLPNEFEDFLTELKPIFSDPMALPLGKMILSYRKEYHPEIDEHLKLFEIPREKVFLKHLGKKDILDVVRGLTSNDRLKRAYRLEIENSLPVVIADDLMEDKDSSIAPVLQILLTKLWQQVEKNEKPKFTVDKYQKLKKEGVLLGDFFLQQMEKVRKWNENVVESGLALDILYYHTSLVGAMNTRTFEQLQKKYVNYQSYDPQKKGFYKNYYSNRAVLLPELIDKFKELYLFVDAPNKGTGLAHDTIAPLIIKEFRESELRGQRAKRILSSKIVDYLAHREDSDLEMGLIRGLAQKIFGKKKNTFLLDEQSLSLVEKGLDGMGVVTAEEDELMFRSRKERKKVQQFIRLIQITGVLFVTVIIYLGFEVNKENGKVREAKKNVEVAMDSVRVSAKIAQNKQLLAEKSQEKADSSARIANQKTLEAMQSATIANEKTKQAIESQEKATESEKSAKNSAEKATESAEKAEKSGLEAKVNSILAAFSQEEAEFGQYQAKAKELAVKTMGMTDTKDKRIKILLALQAYHFNKLAYSNLKNNIDSTKKEIENMKKEIGKDNHLKVFFKEKIEKMNKESNKLTIKASNIQTPVEIFEALREAYLLNWKSDIAQKVARNVEKDEVFHEKVESWDIEITDKNYLFLSSPKGGTMLGEFKESKEFFPEIGITQEISNMKYNFFTSAENKIFASSKDGKVLYWNSKNSINKPVMIAQKKSNILALSYSKSTKEIIYSEKGTIFFQKQDPNKKDDLFSVKREISIDPSHVRVLEMIEDNKYCYLVVGNEKGNLYKIDLKAKDGILVAEKLNYDAKGIRGGFHCADYNASKDKLVLGTGKGELLFFTLSPSDMLTTGTKLLFPKTISNISEGIVIDLAFSSKGDLLAIAHFSGQITLSKLPQSEDDLQILLSFNNKKKVFAVNFSPDDNYLFFSDEEKLRVCPTDSKILYQKLFLQKDLFLDKEKTTLDKDEWKKYISIEFPQEKCKIKQE